MGENCILYPQGNLAEAKAAIERILTDAELRKKLDTGAEETVKERKLEKNRTTDFRTVSWKINKQQKGLSH